MSPLDSHLESLASQRLLDRLDNRMGHALFVGAWLPEVALDLANKGLTITLVESRKEAIDRFLAVFSAHRMDNSVSVDSRPYSLIEFQGSSYNAMVFRDSIPEGMPPALFFKKVRRELKAGSNLYLNARLRPDVEATLPEKVRPIVALAQSKLRSMGILPGSTLPTEGELRAAADTYLGFIENIPLTVALAPLGRFPWLESKIPDRLLRELIHLDSALSSHGSLRHLASHSLLVFSKNKDFGRVFRI
mgnify:CR=1 FL=1